ncbi:VOC family protein [Lentilactobacillus sp. SPB1-3]|uniref:VOC family protein n=1 Tax=Lentilactobacillus terminaliae TaxID=3003483 RepID=A0ACD5DFD9_9LACO|nr:VOC family protein [Lentilactobacillus sp. SPB1-3]MCZ0976383.1 VOC family protein [Lentilactobacillus sp. SPB1-3]
MSLSVYLYFNGNCKEAIEFYSDVFGVADDDRQITTYKNASDFGGNPEDADRIIRSSIKVGDMKILMADVAKGSNLRQGNNFALQFETRDENELRTVYDRLSEGGKVHLPLQDSFFTSLFANLTDKFGISWQLRLEK